MTKNKLRKIKIANDTYLWKVNHSHLENFTYSKYVEKVVVYLEGHKKSPLRLLFREEDNLALKKDLKKEKWCVGYPDTGVIWLYTYKPPLPNNESYPIEQQKTIYINLNRPAVIAKFITYFTKTQWKPKKNEKPLIIENALKFLEIIKLPKGYK